MPDSTGHLTCPICAGDANVLKILSADFLRSSAEAFLGEKSEAAVTWEEYRLCECTNCTLQFSDPMLPGGDALYQWLDRDGRYYLEERWEWDRVERIVAEQASVRPVKVLEFGAGDGRFLKRLSAIPNVQAVAIERSAEAAARLEGEGIEAYEVAKAEALIGQRTFDFVLSFHCLEHVGDPLGFLRKQRQFASTAGKIIFSVPFSPMHFETHMFDPLNHPPHHMTRWNVRSLRQVGEEMAEDVRLESPHAYGLFRRVRHALYCAKFGAHWDRGSRLRRCLALIGPVALWREFRVQRNRARINGRAAGDVVLVKMTVPNDSMHA